MRKNYQLALEVAGADGVAGGLWVQLLPDDALMANTNECAVWDRQTVLLDDLPLDLVRPGGLSLGIGPCAPAQFYVKFAYDEWKDLPELQVSIRDDSGTSTFLFENFIRTPVIVVEEPADANVRRGESFVLRFDPSTDILPAFQMIARGLPGELGMGWTSTTMAKVAIDHFRARFVVPADARIGATKLYFDSGNFPPTYGYRVGVLSCEDAIRCTGRRVQGGGTKTPSNELDDDTVEVSLTVVE